MPFLASKIQLVGAFFDKINHSRDELLKRVDMDRTSVLCEMIITVSVQSLH